MALHATLRTKWFCFPAFEVWGLFGKKEQEEKVGVLVEVALPSTAWVGVRVG